MHVSTVATHFPIPESSTSLKQALTRIHELGASSSSFDRHGKAVGKAVVAIAISVFDTAAYTGKALGGFCIAFIDLSFLESVELLAENGADALRSLCMVVILIGSVVSGFFIPVTVFGSFPIYHPTVPESSPSTAPVQTSATVDQAQIDHPTVLEPVLSTAPVQTGATVDQAQIEQLQQQKAELERQNADSERTLKAKEIRLTALDEKIKVKAECLGKVENMLKAGSAQIEKLKADIAALELQKQAIAGSARS